MLAKLFLVVSLAILVVCNPLPKNENELVSTALNSGTHLLKAYSKFISGDAERYSLDLNLLYKKFGVEPKIDEIKSYLETEYKKKAVIIYELIKQYDTDSELQLKELTDLMKKDDPMSGKLLKLLHKMRDLHRANEEFLKYYYIDSDLFGYTLGNILDIQEHELAQKIKKIEASMIEYIPKKSLSA